MGNSKRLECLEIHVENIDLHLCCLHMASDFLITCVLGLVISTYKISKMPSEDSDLKKAETCLLKKFKG